MIRKCCIEFFSFQAIFFTGLPGTTSPQHKSKKLNFKPKSHKIRPQLTTRHLSDVGEVSKSVICSPSTKTSSNSIALSNSSVGNSVHTCASPKAKDIDCIKPSSKQLRNKKVRSLLA